MTEKQVEELRGYRFHVSENRLQELKNMDKEALVKYAGISEMRFDSIQEDENSLSVQDRGVQNSMAKDGYEDCSVTWTTLKFEKHPWE